MTPARIVAETHADGLTLTLEGSAIVVGGPASARARWLPAIRANKPALVTLLSGTHLPPRAANQDPVNPARHVYRLLVAMPDERPPRWMTLRCPTCDLTEAKRTAEVQFGANRVIEVHARIHPPEVVPPEHTGPRDVRGTSRDPDAPGRAQPVRALTRWALPWSR